jgi:hypothetical protein
VQESIQLSIVILVKGGRLILTKRIRKMSLSDGKQSVFKTMNIIYNIEVIKSKYVNDIDCYQR